MPSRWACIAIVGAWLIAMTWLFQREILPLLQADAPPPYSIDLVDESRNQHRIRWNVYLEKDGPSNEEDGGPRAMAQAQTWVEAREKPDESFAFRMELGPIPGRRPLDLGMLKLQSVKGLTRVNRQGELLEMRVEVKIDVVPVALKDVGIDLSGQMVDGQFAANYRVALGTDSRSVLEGDIEPFPLSNNTPVLQPLQPVHRIRGLYPGQRWRQPQVNPLEESCSPGWKSPA